jgi:GH24 family phage-related lysozyme (muramidase)
MHISLINEGLSHLKPGWWFGTWLSFVYNIGNNNSNWLIFFRRLESTNQKLLRTTTAVIKPL